MDPDALPPETPAAPTFGQLHSIWVEVIWTEAAGALSYKLERANDCTDAPCQWEDVAVGITGTTYTAWIDGNTAYWFRVRGTNAAGDGAPGPARKVVALPNEPSGLSITLVQHNSISLEWNAPPGGAASYTVKRAAASIGPWSAVASGVVSTTHVDSTVMANQTYWYRVVGVNSAGVEGRPSATVSVTTAIDPAVSLDLAPVQ